MNFYFSSGFDRAVPIFVAFHLEPDVVKTQSRYRTDKAAGDPRARGRCSSGCCRRWWNGDGGFRLVYRSGQCGGN